MRTGILIFICILLLTGCTKHEEKIDEERTKLQEEKVNLFLERWDIAYDYKDVLEMIGQLKAEWEDLQYSKTYTIKYQQEEEAIEVFGEYTSRNDWRLTGTGIGTSTFHVHKGSESLVLEYDGYQERLSFEEVMFLLPTHHLEILQVLLEDEAYARITWEPSDTGWKVQVISPLDPFYVDFQRFLFSEQKETTDHPEQFARYQMQYQFKIKTQNDQRQLSEMTFLLDKNGDILEEIQFVF